MDMSWFEEWVLAPLTRGCSERRSDREDSGGDRPVICETPRAPPQTVPGRVPDDLAGLDVYERRRIIAQRSAEIIAGAGVVLPTTSSFNSRPSVGSPLSSNSTTRPPFLSFSKQQAEIRRKEIEEAKAKRKELAARSAEIIAAVER